MEVSGSNDSKPDGAGGWFFAQDRLFRQVGACLDTLTVPRHLLGYRYIQCAVEFIVRQENSIKLGMMKDVYPYVAQEMDTSPVMVDRAMRHAVEVCWTRGSVRMHRHVFGYCAYDKKGMPINAEFVYSVAEHMRPLLLTAKDSSTFSKMLKEIEESINDN